SIVRTRYCNLREALSPEEVTAASRAVCDHLARWPILHSAGTVLTYLAFRNEVDLSGLFAALPDIDWVIPRIEGPRLVLHPYDPAHLVRHHFGMLEPDPELPQVDPGTLDVVLVPGTAFARHGGRVGFGGGYYDRLLPTTPALRVGVTYSPCLLEEVPCDEYDQRMHWVVTPAGLLNVDQASCGD
ncbi:MAG: 5-formyltetrahydrofolate cyclo-ligase, partial [Anaerolineae bacterium]